MGKIVAKFGGSSLASAEQFRKSAAIVLAEESRRYVVPSAPGKRFPEDEKYTAMVKSLATVADAVFAATFDEKMNLFGVLASAEHGILSLFPGEEGENGTITFTIPGENENELEGEEAHGET